jgi:hypothetical protein
LARPIGSLVRNALAVRLLVTVLLARNGMGMVPPARIGGVHHPCPWCGKNASRSADKPFAFWCRLPVGGVPRRAKRSRAELHGLAAG